MERLQIRHRRGRKEELTPILSRQWCAAHNEFKEGFCFSHVIDNML
jgi:hypothetical protein